MKKIAILSAVSAVMMVSSLAQAKKARIDIPVYVGVPGTEYVYLKGSVSISNGTVATPMAAPFQVSRNFCYDIGFLQGGGTQECKTVQGLEASYTGATIGSVDVSLVMEDGTVLGKVSNNEPIIVDRGANTVMKLFRPNQKVNDDRINMLANDSTLLVRYLPFATGYDFSLPGGYSVRIGAYNPGFAIRLVMNLQTGALTVKNGEVNFQDELKYDIEVLGKFNEIIKKQQSFNVQLRF